MYAYAVMYKKQDRLFPLDLMITNEKWRNRLVYLYDVNIFSDNMYDHIRHVKEILTTSADADVTIKITKCHFF